MAIKITYFVHGTTTDNENHIGTGWLPGTLSELGVQQAKSLSRLVKEKTFDAFFCSDLKRAVDSAQLGFGEQYDIKPDARLRECNYGDLNGASEYETKTDHVDVQYPNGESYRDVERRVKNFLEEMQDTYEGKHIAILAHQAPQLSLEVLLNGKTWPQAFAGDWRKTKSWKPGWEYVFE